MNGRKTIRLLLGLVLSVSLLSVSITAVLMAKQYHHMQFQLLGNICRRITEQDPEAEPVVLKALKGYQDNSADGLTEGPESPGADYLQAYGYREKDFLVPTQRAVLLLAAAGFLCGGFLFLSAFLYRNRRERLRIQALTEYLEAMNHGGSARILMAEEDEFSRLQDEIYKTVTFACQTRDGALEARQNFAENLSNIAHQLKTPITAMSLSAQMICVQAGNPSSVKAHAAQMEKQLKRLTHLEEALLLLSRLDSGTLPMELQAVDVFTLLTLAADNLQEVWEGLGVSADIPEMGEVQVKADLEWTMEAVMNLMKNCGEHSPEGGVVRCAYHQTPLYTEILIRDEGDGFAGEDIPHLFQRFYRGQRAKDGGIGIGLSIAKAILERENGTITARNLPEGGACFEIRIYTSA